MLQHGFVYEELCRWDRGGGPLPPISYTHNTFTIQAQQRLNYGGTVVGSEDESASDGFPCCGGGGGGGQTRHPNSHPAVQ
jgi:hypothetical protein